VRIPVDPGIYPEVNGIWPDSSVELLILHPADIEVHDLVELFELLFLIKSRSRLGEDCIEVEGLI